MIGKECIKSEVNLLSDLFLIKLEEFDEKIKNLSIKEDKMSENNLNIIGYLRNNFSAESYFRSQRLSSILNKVNNGNPYHDTLGKFTFTPYQKYPLMQISVKKLINIKKANPDIYNDEFYNAVYSERTQLHQKYSSIEEMEKTDKAIEDWVHGDILEDKNSIQFSDIDVALSKALTKELHNQETVYRGQYDSDVINSKSITSWTPYEGIAIGFGKKAAQINEAEKVSLFKTKITDKNVILSPEVIYSVDMARDWRSQQEFIVQTHKISAYHTEDVNSINPFKQYDVENNLHDIILAKNESIWNNNGGGNPYHDKLGRFSSKNGTTISESKLNDILLEFPNDYKNQESSMMESIAKEIGFDKQPIKVSKKEFDSNSNDIIYRGISDFKEGDIFIPEITLIEQFYSGKYYAGNGKYGPGIYMHKERNYSEDYSGSGVLVECKLSSNAKIMNIKQSIPTSKEYAFEKDFQNYRTIKSQEYLDKSEKAYLSKNSELGEKYKTLAKEYSSMEISTFAAIKGYDAIRDPLGEYIILNRGKCIYRESELKKESNNIERLNNLLKNANPYHDELGKFTTGHGKSSKDSSKYDDYISKAVRFAKLVKQTNWNSNELHSVLPYFGDFKNTAKVQNYLMGGDDSSISMTAMASDCVREMKQKMKNTTFKEDETLYRGMWIRNDRIQKSIDNGFSYSGFQSTTMVGNHATEILQEQAKTGKYDKKYYTLVLLKINAKKGGHFAASPYDVEHEIVLPDNIKFKVKSQKENSSGYKIFEVDYEE